MNWINKVVRPKIQRILAKREVPDNVWLKCPESGQMIHFKDLEANLRSVGQDGTTPAARSEGADGCQRQCSRVHR